MQAMVTKESTRIKTMNTDTIEIKTASEISEISARGKKIRVMVVDDSALMRKLLSEILSSDREIEVVDTAMDAYAAREKIKKHDPDVITLDVEMPKMDGISFLRNLMRLRPMPVVMVSTVTEKSAAATLEALSLGAIDYVTKPKIDVTSAIHDYADELIAKVKQAAAAKQRLRAGTLKTTSTQAKPAADLTHILSRAKRSYSTTHKVIAIGASTGGTEAIREVLDQLPEDCPGVVIAQHIPVTFSRSFAERLNATSRLTVKQAVDGDWIVPGHAYVAPGDRHLLVVRDGARYRCKLDDGPKVNRHKPSVDALFHSVATSAGRDALGVILSGMGKDGAEGLRLMRQQGAYTIAQDEATSVVWGMPGEAVRLQAAKAIAPVEHVARQILVGLAEEKGQIDSQGE